jgi:hypothetical protein
MVRSCVHPRFASFWFAAALCICILVVVTSLLRIVTGVAGVLLPGADTGGRHAVLAAVQAGGVDRVARQAEAPAAGGALGSSCCTASQIVLLSGSPLTCSLSSAAGACSSAYVSHYADRINHVFCYGRGELLLLQGKGRGFDMWKATCWARTYWHRLVGTALSWLIWDFAFYGVQMRNPHANLHILGAPQRTILGAVLWQTRVHASTNGLACCSPVDAVSMRLQATSCFRGR